MTKFLLPRGLQGSGKSTWAVLYLKDHPNTRRVCRDDLRFMLGFGWKFNKDNENYVKELRNKIIQDLFEQGHDIIVDELNLSGNTERYLRQRYPIAEFEIVDFTQVDVNLCIRRDGMRPHTVGAKVILDAYRRYIQKQYEPFHWTEKGKAIIVDLDGTYSLFHNKNPYDRDFENDVLNDRLWEILHQMFWNDYEILIVSGRSDKFFEQTCQFLEKNRIEFSQLWMRKEGDRRSDVIVKQEIYEEHIKNKYNVFCVFDDRKQMKRFWVSQGLYVFDCNQDDVEF